MIAIIEALKAIESETKNTWNKILFWNTAIPILLPALWSYPPGKVNPAVNDTVAIRAATTKRFCAASLSDLESPLLPHNLSKLHSQHQHLLHMCLFAFPYEVVFVLSACKIMYVVTNNLRPKLTRCLFRGIRSSDRDYKFEKDHIPYLFVGHGIIYKDMDGIKILLIPLN